MRSKPAVRARFAAFLKSSMIFSMPARSRVGGEGVVVVEADGGGCDGLPSAFGGRDGAGFFPWDGHAGFAAGVRELGAGVGSVLVEEGGDALEGGDVLVFPDAEIGWD